LFKTLIMRFTVSLVFSVWVWVGCASAQIAQAGDQLRYFEGTRAISYTRTATAFGCVHTAFNRAGEVIWTQEDIRQSYSVASTLEFYPDNQLKRAEVHTNPGADINWYDTIYEWDSLGRITREEHQVSGMLSSAIYTTYDPDGTPRQSIACAAPGLR
jgi:hypothetical protein